MSGATLIGVGIAGFLLLFAVAWRDQRRVAADARQRVMLTVVGLMVPTQALLTLRGADEELRFVFGLALCLFVLVGLVVLAVTSVRGDPSLGRSESD